MYPLFFIAKNNIKKHKGEVAILFALIFFAAMLLFCSITLILSGDKAVSECKDKYHASDLVVVAPQTDNDEMKKAIESVDATEKCELIPTIQIAADYYYGDMKAEDAATFSYYIFDSSRPTYLNTFPEEFKDLKDDEIILPYYLSYTNSIGQDYHIVVGGKDYAFKVKGYVENLYFATTMNISSYYGLVSHDVFEEISNSVDPLSIQVFANIDAKEGTDIDEFDVAVQRALPGDLTLFTITIQTMEVATTAITKIASSLIIVFTLLLIVMSVIIMHFSIKNFIELNTQNIGLLQATGYTAKSLRLACITEQMIIGVIATVAGIGAGMFCAKPLGYLSGMLSGLSYFDTVCIPALISTIVVIPLMVLIGSVIATRSYKKLTVLESLRSGITSHNFKKNHCPLETNRMPLSLALACKNNLGALKKSIFVVIIVALLTMSTCIGFALFQNWVLDTKTLMKIVGYEFSDIEVGSAGDEEFYEAISRNPEIRKVNTLSTFQSVEVSYQDKTTSLGVDVYRDVTVLENNYLLEGHAPEKENEIVLTNVEAGILGVTTGDIVNVKSLTGTGTVPYTVSGIDQKMNNTGKKAIMSEAGIKRINEDYQYLSALVFLKDPSKAKDLKKQWAEEYPNFQFVLGADVVASSIDTVAKAMEGICVIFVIATCFVVILTQLLLTRAQVIRERTDLGVSKALGYTSGELIKRTLMTNMPTITLGIVLGIILHIAFSNNLFLAVFSFFGIKQIVFSTDVIWFILTAAMILVCALITAYLSGRRITKLEPVKILKEE